MIGCMDSNEIAQSDDPHSIRAPVRFDLSAIRRHPLVRSVAYHDQLESTSDTAIMVARNGCCSADGSTEATADFPLLVLTANQTAGRGQRSNRWFAGQGSLTFSLMVDAADIEVADPFSTQSASGYRTLIPLAVGLACARALNGFAKGVLDKNRNDVRPEPVQISWPNDLVTVKNSSVKKLGGILVETVAYSGRKFIVIGIGINVCNRIDEVPESIVGQACSLIDILEIPLTEETVDLTGVLLAVLSQLETALVKLRKCPELLFGDVERLLVTNGQRVGFTEPGRTKLRNGLCCGLDPSGGLLIRPAGASLADPPICFQSGQVVLNGPVIPMEPGGNPRAVFPNTE